MIETLFQISNILVLPFWLVMIALPHWRWTKRIIGSPWIAAPTALLYAILVIPSAATLLPALAQPTLAGIAALLGTPEAAAIAWAHFLTFDLLDRALGVSRQPRAQHQRVGYGAGPAADFLLGPLGFLLYLLVRSAASLVAGRGPAIAD